MRKKETPDKRRSYWTVWHPTHHVCLLMICLTLLFHCAQSMFKNTHCWLRSLTVQQGGILEHKKKGRGGGIFHSTVHKYEWVSHARRDLMTSFFLLFFCCYFLLFQGLCWSWQGVCGVGSRLKEQFYSVWFLSPKEERRRHGCRYCWDREEERTTQEGFIHHVYKWRYRETEPGAKGQHRKPRDSSPGCLSSGGVTVMRLKMWRIRVRLQVSKAKDNDEEGIIIIVEVCMRGSWQWENQVASHKHFSIFFSFLS